MELSRIFPSLLLGSAIALVQPEIARALSSAEVAQIAQSITVKIQSTLRFLEGKVTANASGLKDIDGGYTLLYSNSTLGGTSGGGVFNEGGEVVAIHGRAETVSNRDKDNPKPISTGNNAGIPINTFLRLAMVDVGTSAPSLIVAKEPI